MILSNSIAGDLWQLPPIYDRLITDKSHVDGRPDLAPNHWKNNFKIYYLTEKMRSQEDPVFSSLCDRVGRDKINDEDEKFLMSRIQSTPSENSNEAFKNGSLSIIVTTNKKRNYVNDQKLAELLPDEKLYSCNSIDYVVNLPDKKSSSRKTSKQSENPGNAGNLLNELNLKIGCPVVITTNHTKKKYREDGICNGTRGFVQSFQMSEKDKDKIEVIWVVFNNENIGKLYRFDHRHLRKSFNPGHERAVPIFPTRRNYKSKFGSVEYQRSNFPLAVAYAVTAHKCQGETLDEVIIDFGPDKEHNISNYICPGSFYVALTRVKRGSKVFLKSFNKSYIKADKSIEEKISAMRKFNAYKFKKLYLDEEIFECNDGELKVGYLNINGLFDGGHIEYLDQDKNLQNLDILVLSETKLSKKCSNDEISKCLTNWNVKTRFDCVDEKKHMGMIVLSRKISNNAKLIKNAKYTTLKRNNDIQIESLIIELINKQSLGFIYCRTKPTKQEASAINDHFDKCSAVFGDLNLSHRTHEDRAKISVICGEDKLSILNEITHLSSLNQLDYILVDKSLEDSVFATSFMNFISDHNSITLRIDFGGSCLKTEYRKRSFFRS